MASLCPAFVGTISLVVNDHDFYAISPDESLIYVVSTDSSAFGSTADRIHRYSNLVANPGTAWYTAPSTAEMIEGIEVMGNYVYWSEKVIVGLSVTRTIKRANLDGTGVTSFITSGIPTANTMELRRHPGMDRIYYSVYGTPGSVGYFNSSGSLTTLGSITATGTNRPTVTSDGAVWIVTVQGFFSITARRFFGGSSSDLVLPGMGAKLITGPAASSSWTSRGFDGTWWSVDPTGASTNYVCSGYTDAGVVDTLYQNFNRGYFLTSPGLGVLNLWLLGSSIPPPLRQRQRDDDFNAPRQKGVGKNPPSSRQYSARHGHGNTYL